MSVKTYRKKPVEVQGVLYTGDNDAEIEAFVGDSVTSLINGPTSNWSVSDGTHRQVWNTSQNAWNDVNPGDTILRGLVGEFYPCSADALAATYDDQPVPPPCACGQPVPEDKFQTGLTALLSQHGKEAGSGTRNFVLSQYLLHCLEAFDYAKRYDRSVQALAPEVSE
jgi:hypothetical protein